MLFLKARLVTFDWKLVFKKPEEADQGAFASDERWPALTGSETPPTTGCGSRVIRRT